MAEVLLKSIQPLFPQGFCYRSTECQLLLEELFRRELLAKVKPVVWWAVLVYELLRMVVLCAPRAKAG